MGDFCAFLIGPVYGFEQKACGREADACLPSLKRYVFVSVGVRETTLAATAEELTLSEKIDIIKAVKKHKNYSNLPWR